MLCLAVALLGLASASAASPEVTVPSLGSLKGVYLDDDSKVSSVATSISSFRGIPYGKAPVGDLRFRPSQLHGPWESPRDATKFGDACMQPLLDFDRLSGNMSEDCLFLNVYSSTDALNSAKKVPVMFWIHGGAYTTGEAVSYDGQGLIKAANGSLVVVTVNYRLNVFGFLGSDQLRSRSADNGTGNHGIQDQRLALEWVRANIGAFGGDGNDITIFGESAGGSSVINHLVQKASFGLYSKAIIQSGAYLSDPSLAEAEAMYAAILRNSGCNNVECLLHLDAKALIAALKTKDLVPMWWGPVIDGVALTASNLDLVAQGTYNNKVPVLLGSNRDEYAFMLLIPGVIKFVPATLSFLELDVLLTQDVGAEKVYEVRKLYDTVNYPLPAQLGNFSEAWWTFMRIRTDSAPGLGPCGVRSLARNLVAGGTASVYAYTFNHPSQTSLHGIVGTGPGSVVVPHAVEIPYALGGAHLFAEEEDRALSAQMAQYWSSFATHGRPGNAGQAVWPDYKTGEDVVLELQTPSEGGIKSLSNLRRAQCDFWDHHEQHSPIAEVQKPRHVLGSSAALFI